MENKQAKSAILIDGREVDPGTARMLMDAVVPSIKRVVEEMVIARRSDDAVKAAAKTTAEAVVGTIIDLLKTRIKSASHDAANFQADAPVLEGSQGQEAQ